MTLNEKEQSFLKLIQATQEDSEFKKLWDEVLDKIRLERQQKEGQLQSTVDTLSQQS